MVVGRGVHTAKCLHDSNGIVVEDSRHVFGGEFVGRVRDQETSLADSTVTDDDTSTQTISLERIS